MSMGDRTFNLEANALEAVKGRRMAQQVVDKCRYIHCPRSSS